MRQEYQKVSNQNTGNEISKFFIIEHSVTAGLVCLFVASFTRTL